MNTFLDWIFRWKDLSSRGRDTWRLSIEAISPIAWESISTSCSNVSQVWNNELGHAGLKRIRRLVFSYIEIVYFAIYGIQIFVHIKKVKTYFQDWRTTKISVYDEALYRSKLNRGRAWLPQAYIFVARHKQTRAKVYGGFLSLLFKRLSRGKNTHCNLTSAIPEAVAMCDTSSQS